MKVPGDDALLRYGEIVRRLSTLTAATDEASGVAFLSALQEMSELLAEALGDLSDASTTKGPLIDDQRRQIVETLRMRMVSSLLLGGASGLNPAQGEFDPQVGTLITTPSGMTYGKACNRCVVLLPDFDTPNKIKEFGSEMIDVFDNAVASSGIVFDCSAVKNLPFVLQGVLLGYKHNLKMHGKSFGLVWLRTDAVPEGSVGQVKSAFGAVEIGQYLFARPSS